MLEKTVIASIEEYRMFSPRDKVIVGVSGGPDSVCLLNILSKLSKQLKISLHVVHLNHMIRGADASKDARFVGRFAKKLKIPVTFGSVDVPGLAKKEKLSLEDAARKARHRFFEETADSLGAKKIALGHTSCDSAETSLMRLISGSGARGLLGISAKRGRIVRPLIDVSRKEIEEYLRKHRSSFRIDKSNLDQRFLRNKIRNKVIPLLESINPNVKNAILRASEILSRDYGYLQEISEKALNGAAVKSSSGSMVLDVDKLLMYPDAVRSYVLRLAIEKVKGDLENITFGHIEDIFANLSSDGDWEIHLPSGIFAVGSGDTLEISTSRPAEKEKVRFEYKLKVPGSVLIREAGVRVNARVIEAPKDLKLKDKDNALIDLNKAGKNFVVRSRRAGDKFSPFGMKGTKKLKDFLTDQKVPSEKKDLVPVVESRGRIVWVAGHRIDDSFKVSKTAKKALRLTLKDAGKRICFR